ncbi:MAG: spore protease YyaC [Bacillota bacterium]
MVNFSFLNNLQTEEKLKLHIDKPFFVSESAEFLNNKIAEMDSSSRRPLITFCIGTDRSTGDSLGPLVGWFLKKKLPANNRIYGTIDNPVHATNMVDILEKIKNQYSQPLIIAVDACLGKLDNVGYVNFTQGSLKPGAAVNKNLPEVGDISISGIVNVGGFMEYLVLQNTRLSFVMNMAETIAQSIALTYRKRE